METTETIIRSISISNPDPIQSLDYESIYYPENDEGAYSLLADILDLSLPLRDKSVMMQDILDKILKITDNQQRLSLLPVLLKYNIHFNDTVYTALASSDRTRKAFYLIMDKANMKNRFPEKYRNHKDWIKADIYELESDYNKIDTFVYINRYKVFIGKDSGLVYAYKFKLEESDEWYLYMSDALPCDTMQLNKADAVPVFYSVKEGISDENELSRMCNDYLFENLLRYTRQRNGGYFDNYSYRRNNSMGMFAWDY